jgi:AcrR family transcriptional regulator
VSLTREAIIAAARDIMSAYGLADLSMRRLAAVLEVQPSALYWHFAHKQNLLAAVARTILDDLPSGADGEWAAGDWAGWLRRWAARLHDLLRRQRGGAELVSSVLALQPWEAGPGAGLATGLTAAGWPPEPARAGAAGLLHLVLGHTLDEEQRAQAHDLGVAAGPDPDSAALLARSVNLLLAGLAAARPV